jgi:hypothetical protein
VRCCMPPDNCQGYLASLLSRPTVLSSAFARSAYSTRLRLKLDRYGSTISSGSSTLSSVVRHGNRFGAWNAIPTIVSGPTTARPPTTTVPCVGARKPLQSFMNVDLPHPDGPTMATNSPRRMRNVMSSTALPLTAS